VTLTRDLGDGGWHYSGRANPPPLHVADHESARANWYPYERPFLVPHTPGPLMVTIPGLPADAYGEDPTDPARCHTPRQATAGLAARIDIHIGQPNVGPGGVRR
jgi:hypothetical protein